MTIVNIPQLQTALLTLPPKEFVSAHLFEPVPYVFENDALLWIGWKTTLADLLEVDPYEIVLTGSGAVGFSLNPAKNFNQFHDGSDIDVAVISAYHFDLAWRCLRRSPPQWLSLPKKMRKAIRSHKQNYVFSGTIATDRILSVMPFARAWEHALDHMRTVAPTVGREVHLRIYRDYESLRGYQTSGIDALRASLTDDEEDVESIGTEDDE
jgi:hypothetical protein